MKRTLTIFLIATALVATSCRKHGVELMNPNTITYETPSEQFEAIWHGINNGYAFWDIDPTNWDSIYMVYSPRFEELDELLEASDYIPTSTLQAYYKDMCYRFIDHHMAVVARNLWKNPDSTDDRGIVVVSPGTIEAQKRTYYHKEFSDSLLISCIEKIEASENIHYYSHGKQGTNEYQSALACNFGGIAYLKLSGYMLTGAFNASDSVGKGIQDVYRIFHKWCAAADLKGIIIDNRGNGGGYLNDMNFVVTPFLKEDMTIGHTRHKEGLGRYDYTPWAPFVLTPRDPLASVDSIGEIDVPIVALADINSVSMGEITTQAIKQMPNGYFIGERTFGGHGPLFGNFEINYAGIVGDAQLQSVAHYIYTSNDVMRDIDGKITEGIGYTPNQEVLFDEAQMRAGIDVQLNAALDYIRNTSKK